MKKFTKYLGVTLLEVMLVLAIAAMIIVMSVRYYQTASYNQQANSALQTIQAVTAAADGLAQGSGDYSAVDQANIAALLPGTVGSVITMPWGGELQITGGGTTVYTVTLTAVPRVICTQLAARFLSQPKFANALTPVADCGDPGAFTFTYDNSK